MGKCLACGCETSDPIRVLEVKTLHVRDLDRAKRVQALGSFQDFYVCDSCAKAREEKERLPLAAASKKLTGFGLVSIAGLVLLAASLLFLHADRVFIMLSLAAIACGVLGIIQSVRDAKERSEELSKMTEKQARFAAAFSVLCDYAPKKSADADLTYIPINGKTLQMKNGDLMVMYKLLPEIAVQAWEKIHREYR